MAVEQIGTLPLRRRLDLWQTRDESQTVSNYGLDMTKYLHLILISDDFKTFLHVHPALENDHHFRIDVQTGSQVTAGPYRVRLGSTRLRTDSENELAVHITKNGHHVRIPEAGTYKLWLQFRGSDRIYAAPFVVTSSSAR